MTWEQAEEKSKPVLRCPLCEGCGLVLSFDAGRGIWNLD